MRATNPRRPTDSSIPQPTPDHRQFSSRDSDASFASNRPSSIGVGGARAISSADLYTDRAHQASAVRAINSYLSSHSFSLSLRTHPISSSKDITETLIFLLHQLDYNPSTKLEDDLFTILKSLSCPFKVNKSTLRAPNTPHNWPTYLALIHWLVQIARYHEHLAANSGPLFESDRMFTYALDSYLSYIRGDDDSVEALDQEFTGKLERERENEVESVKALERSYGEIQAKAEELRAGPTEKEKLEKDRPVLEEDVKKFNAMIGEFNQRIEAMEKVLEEKTKELGTKIEEKKRIDEENEELKKRVEDQSFNARDAERMKRELQAVERDIGEAENARSSWEEKMWDIDGVIGHKFKEMEALAMECNQAVRRLKFGNGFQYALNHKGSTPAEVMGPDYKSIVKPGLASFADDIKKSSVEKLDKLILLQQQSSELTAKIEGKRSHIDTLQSHIDEVEEQLNLSRKETEDYTSRCAAEAKKLVEDFQMESHSLDALERDAAECLKASKLKLQETVKQSEEEIQMQAHELFALVDSVSKYKETMESRISEMKGKLSETVSAVSNAYKGSLTSQFGINDGVGS